MPDSDMQATEDRTKDLTRRQFAIGMATVAAFALALRLAGTRAGLIAAAIGAVYPMLWINDGMLVSESMYVLIVGAILLAAYQLWESRATRDALLLGGAIGLGCLTRPEAIMLVPFI